MKGCSTDLLALLKLFNAFSEGQYETACCFMQCLQVAHAREEASTVYACICVEKERPAT